MRNVDLSLNEKLLIINYSLLIPEIFPWKDELSEGIDHEKFCKSFFVQPDLFLRLRPGKEKLVKEKLQLGEDRFYNDYLKLVLLYPMLQSLMK